jgi:hypothetical protein
MLGRTLDEARGLARDAGLELTVEEEATDQAPPGTVIRQDPGPGAPVQNGDRVRVVVARPSSTVTVPTVRGFTPSDAANALIDVGLQPGEQRERFHDAVNAGLVIRTDPGAGTEVERGSVVAVFVSRGPRPPDATPEPIPPETPPTAETPPADDTPPPDDITPLVDEVVQQVPPIRGLEPTSDVPYRQVAPREFRRELRRLFDAKNPPERVAAEEDLLKRLGLLPPDADLRQLLLQLYQSQVAAYYDTDTGTMTIIQRDGAFGPEEQVFVAHEYDHALQDQHFDLDELEVRDRTQGDRALARLGLIEGDATALMMEWALQHLDPDEMSDLGSSLSPTDQALLANTPPILRRQLEFPYLDGYLFVNTLRGGGGWRPVNDAFGQPPASTEQVMHPELYPSERPVRIELPDLAGSLGDGWVESEVQTMGEMQLGVWVADGQGGAGAAGLQLPNASAAAGWGGDRIASLDGPGETWAVVWQTAWDSDGDGQEFTAAAEAAMADLAGAHAVVPGGDVVGGLPAPVLVVVASDDETLTQVRQGLGVGE